MINKKQKKSWVALLLTMLIGKFCLLHAKELSIGEQMHEVNHKLNDISGNQITLNQIKGKYGTVMKISN